MALIDRIKCDVGTEITPDVLVWKYPKDNVVLGSQLIVNQSQEALFFKDGRALDLFGPGVHTIIADNVPILQKLVNLPFGGKTPFAAEVFFINKTSRLDYKWGTRSPIPVEDPKYRLLIQVGAFGQFGLRVNDSRKLVTGLVGTMPVWDGGQATEYFKGLVLTKVKDNIAKFLVVKSISIVEITAFLDELSKIADAAIREELARFGLELVNFFITSITVPDDQLEIIRKAQATRMEMDMLGDDRYLRKRQLDVQQAAAENPGAPGTLLAGGLGLGMGAQMMQQAGQMMQQPPAPPTAECPKCRTRSPAGTKFCGQCGAEIAPAAKCPHCGAQTAAGARFCPSCGKPQAGAKCPKCGAELAAGAKFCSGCGSPA
jgi:membrane protease subunit (stomatin/prohibitin family)